MALVPSTFKNDLLAAFQSMTDGDNQVFADRVAAACKAFAESGLITTTDAGTVPAGAFTGTGSGGISCDDAPCAQAIMAACTAMNSMTSGGDAYLAAQLATAFHDMVLNGEVICNVSGTVVPSSGGSSPLSGTTKGTLTGVTAPMQAAFFSAFQAMFAMTEGGDGYMAAQIATAVDAYLKAGTVDTQGQGALAGSVGAGAMA